MLLAFLDTETIGMPEDKIFSADENLITQLAVIFKKDKSLKLFSDYSKPRRYKDMTTKAMALSHITPEMLEDKPSIENTRSYQALMKAPEDVIYIAHNMKFDKAVLERVGVNMKYYIDTMKLIKFINQNEDMRFESMTLQYMIYYFRLDRNRDKLYSILGIKEKLESHNAIFDTVDLVLLYSYLKQKYEMEIEDMIELSMNPIFLMRFPYGSNKGKLFTEMTQGQLEYQLENTDDEDVKYTIERILS